jgi:hypothetical protein
MLSTINGFDLLLIIIIVIASFKIYNLNRECESYVGQIMQVSWELQQEIQAHKNTIRNADKCIYCVGIEDFITGDECICPPF